MKNQVNLSYYSDVLCFWAYAAQIRLDELEKKFDKKILIKHHFISVFGNTEQRIGERWSDRGGYAGFARYVIDAAKAFPHLHDVARVAEWEPYHLHDLGQLCFVGPVLYSTTSRSCRLGSEWSI